MSLLQKILGRDGVSQARVALGGNIYTELRTPGVNDAVFLGSYGLSVTTGTLAAALAANGQVFSCRWGDATAIAVITRLRAQILPLTLFTAATLTDYTSLDALIARAFTVSASGGTAINLTGNNLKRRTSFASTAFTDIRVSSTAALTAGTQTLDANAFTGSLRKGNRINPAAATEEVITSSEDGFLICFDVNRGTYPIVLAQNEGVVIRNRTTWPAAGTAVAKIEMEWSEYANAAGY